MSHPAAEPPLRPWLRQQLGLELEQQTPVGGGCIHRAWRLQLRHGPVLFAKTNRAALLPLLEAEADGLTALAAAAAGELAIPRPLHWGCCGDQAVLLLEWLPLERTPHHAEEAWQQLGAALARLHRRSLEQADGRYGWSGDNWIGSSPQRNGWSTSWGTFFAERRLGEQLRWARRRGQRLAGGEELLERVPHWLDGHRAEPVLVHGDLWSGNAGLLEDGRGALFDPAVYRGDREVDLAMARLFGGFPSAFFHGYQQSWPLPPGHDRRLELYNLYHLLNHANLFGGSYWQQSAASIASLLRGAD